VTIHEQIKAAVILQARQEMRETTGRFGRHVGEDLEAVERALVLMVKCWAIARDPGSRFGLQRKVDVAHQGAIRKIVVQDCPPGKSRRGLSLVHIYSRNTQGLAHYKTDIDPYRSANQILKGIEWMFLWLETQVPPLIKLAECADG